MTVGTMPSPGANAASPCSRAAVRNPAGPGTPRTSPATGRTSRTPPPARRQATTASRSGTRPDPKPGRPSTSCGASSAVTASMTWSRLTRPAKNAADQATRVPERSTGTSLKPTGVVPPGDRPPPLGSDDVRDYTDVLAQPRRRREVREVPVEQNLVVETADGGFCGAVVELGRAVVAGEKRDIVTLEDRHGRRRMFPLLAAAFLLEGELVTLVRPAPVRPTGPTARARTA